jgi:replicative DNA helicase
MSPPVSLEAEKGVLCSMLVSPNAIPECVQSLTEEHFNSFSHQTIYRILVELWSNGVAIDLITFTQILRDRNLLDKIGGAFYITSLFTFVPTAANLQYYIDIVRDKFTARKIIESCTLAIQEAYTNNEDPEAIIAEIQELISNLSTNHFTRERKSIRALVEDKILRMEKGEQDSDIIKTGLEKLDYHSPLHNSDMPVISGEKKSGKTILALSIARNVAGWGIPVAIFTLESSAQEVVDRLLSGISRIPTSKQDHVVNLNQDEIRKSAAASSILSELPIHIYDNLYDLHHIIAEARRLKDQRKIGLGIVDYGQLVRSGLHDTNREQEVAHVSRSFRLLAMQLGIPIIVLSQLNDEGKTRESRGLENDCTCMWKIAPDKNEQHIRWLEIPFQRMGESNIRFPVTFLGHIARVENYAEGI